MNRGRSPKIEPAMCICIQKQITYMHIFRGSPSYFMKPNHKYLTSPIFIPVENFNQFVINHQKGGDC